MFDEFVNTDLFLAAYKGFKTRQKILKRNDSLPDLNCADVANAAVKIQAAYRGFQTRQKVKHINEDDLPDLKCADVANVIVNIISLFIIFFRLYWMELIVLCYLVKQQMVIFLLMRL